MACGATRQLRASVAAVHPRLLIQFDQRDVSRRTQPYKFQRRTLGADHRLLGPLDRHPKARLIAGEFSLARLALGRFVLATHIQGTMDPFLHDGPERARLVPSDMDEFATERLVG
jgi:hypothetical protein